MAESVYWRPLEDRGWLLLSGPRILDPQDLGFRPIPAEQVVSFGFRDGGQVVTLRPSATPQEQHG